MRNDRDQEKADAELAVFREFAQVCPVRLLAETAVSVEPDPPDVRCRLKDGTSLAFELAECEGVTTNPQGQRKTPVPIQKVYERTIKLDLALRSALVDAHSSGKIDPPERFKAHFVVVSFEPTAGDSKCVAAAPRAIELLNQLGPGSHPVNKHNIRSITCRPSGLSFGNYLLPHISSSGEGCHVAHNIIEIAERKLRRNYEYDVPVHLLLYSQVAYADDVIYDQLADILRTTMGRFDRVWVYGRGDTAIVFDSEA
jgi:hypothetical protein